MVSSLATQLAQGSSLNAAFITERTSGKRKTTQSYLFTGRDAAKYDLDTVYALAANGLLQLRSLDGRLSNFEESLFSSRARETDRTLQTKEENVKLDATIEDFLALIGPFLLEASAGKVLEWLVRRFRIHEFNVDAVLALFLPYHESPHFAKMLTILHISDRSTHGYLLSTQQATLPLSRQNLVTAMLKSADLIRFIVSLIPEAIKARTVHQTLLTFHTAVMVEYLQRATQANPEGLDESVLAILIPSFLAPLQHHKVSQHLEPSKGAIYSSFTTLVMLSRSCKFVPAALKVIIEAIVLGCTQIPCDQVLQFAMLVAGPQELQDRWSKKTVAGLSKLPDLPVLLQAMFKYQGIEKLVCPLLPRMISQLSTVNAAVIDSLVAHNETSPIVLEHLATLVLRLLLDTPEHGEEDVDSEHAKVIQLLSSIQQRHPSVVQAAMSAITSNDPTHQSTIDKVILSLAISGSSSVTFAGGASAQMDVVLASKHADPAVRAIAIRDIHKALATWGNVEADEVITLRAALKARIEDPAPAVLVALYAEPRILLSVLQEDPVAYITAVAAAIYPESGSSSASRAIVRSHVDFLSFTFLPAFTGDDPAAVGVVRLAFEKIYFPSLLLSNPRHKTARTVWSAITDVRAEQGTNAMELVQGCVETYLWGMQEAGVDTNPTKKGQSEGKVNQKDPQERAMAKVNIAISARMGELIAMSESRAAYTDFLLSTLKSTNSHARLLAALVLRSFLGNVSGSLQIMAAHRILDVVGSESIATMSGFMGGADNLQAFLSDDALGLATVLKPNSSNTRDKLHASLLVLIPLIPRPRGITLDWIAQGSSSLNDTPGPQFVGLLQRLYGIANASALLPLLSTNLLRALFISLGPDTLLFLTGISSITAPTSALGSKEERIAHAALSHAVAFFAAHQGASGPTDFQTVVPSLIVDLQTESRIVREAALECLALVNRLVQTGKPESVYAMDDVYGHHSSKIQFIDWVDLGKYLTALLLQHDHLVGSAAYLAHFHGEHLTRQKGDGKKEGTYKQRTLCYLLSHVQAVPLLPLRASLVKSLAEVSSAVKLDMLHDLLDDVLKMERKVLEDTYGSDTEAFVIALVKMFGGTSGSAIRDPSGKEWVLFKKTISRCLGPDFFPSAEHYLVHALQRSIYKGLAQEQQIELCKFALGLAQESEDIALTVKSLLGSMLQEDQIAIQLVQYVRPTSRDESSRASKRVKINGDSPATTRAIATEDQLLPLTLIAETLATITLPASLELVSTLLESLGTVTQIFGYADGEVTYVQQLLMNALDAATTPVLAAQSTGTKMGAIRLDILVELIRVTTNPQTFHQALLLVAHIAPLARESILHNLMPIFTFMGSNVLHRDDAYSFRVVQKTIESIVPVMVSSLKQTHKEPLHIWISVKRFLQVFTDASNHVPRHRRTHFFSHLVDTLGPDEFLAPLCMLLIDKSANRVTKQSLPDAQATLALPLALVHKQGAVRQVRVMQALIDESRRQLWKLAGRDQLAFLSDVSDEGSALSAVVTISRRAQALVVFAGFTAQLTPATTFSDPQIASEGPATLVSSLIDLSSQPSIAEHPAVEKSIHATTHSVLSVVSAKDFLSIVQGMFTSNDEHLQRGAFIMIAERMERIADTVRLKAKESISSIVVSLTSVLLTSTSSTMLSSALKALTSIITSSIPSEESILLNTVDILMRFVHKREHHVLALKALRPLTTFLGPRLIPHLHVVVLECVAVIQDDGIDPATADDALGVLSSSLSTIPTFWGKNELTSVLQLYVHKRYPDALETTLKSFMKALSRKVPAKTLLTVLCEAYTQLQVSGSEDAVERYVAFFQVLKRGLHAAPRSEVQAQLRPLFKVFLDAFERRQRILEVNDDEGEEHVIYAFIEMVVKLNEATFRPLFRKLFDWAFHDDGKVFEKITFCRTYSAVLDYFKNLMTPYMSFLLPPFKTTLANFEVGTSENQVLWASIIDIISKTFSYDEGTFWRDDQLKQIGGPLVKQVTVCVDLGLPGEGSTLQECLSNLLDVVSDDALLKSVNLDVLMHTRAEEPRARVYALQCAEVIWRNHGSKLLGLVTESVTFVAECAEDESDSVVEAALKLKDAMEAVAGNISDM